MSKEVTTIVEMIAILAAVAAAIMNLLAARKSSSSQSGMLASMDKMTGTAQTFESNMKRAFRIIQDQQSQSGKTMAKLVAIMERDR